METRTAIIGIFIYDAEAANRINDLLHEYSSHIVGRMGIPYREKAVSVISIIINAPAEIIGALSGKLGMVQNVQVKTIYSKV